MVLNIDSSIRPALDRVRQLEMMNHVLRIAAHDNNLLRRETFEALAKVLASYIPLDCMAVVVPEPGGKRLYAASLAGDERPMPPFGARFPHGPKEETVLNKGVIKLCDDTRSTQALDQIAVQWGFLSYAIVPIRRRVWGLDHAGTAGPDRSDSDVIVGKLIVAFRETGYASKTPLDLLTLLADLFGETFDRSLSLARDRRLAMIIETSGEAMLAFDTDGRVTDANVAAERMLGAPRPKLLGFSAHELLDLDQIQIERARANAEPTRAVRTTLTPVGPGPSPESIPVSVTLSSVDDDPVVSIHALLRDDSHIVATEREAALHFTRVRELEKELRTILDNAPLIIFRLDPSTGALKYLNRHAERLLGVPMSEALSAPDFLRAVHRGVDALEAFDAAVRQARAGEVSPPYEARLQWGESEEIAVRGTIYPLRGENGDVAAIEGILADVSAEHAARARAVQADRLSSLGLLAASVAHEINNPASFILLGLGNLERLLGGLEAPEDADRVASARALLVEVRDSLHRIVRIVRDLRVFASPSRGDVTRVADVNEVVESALSLARGRIMERADLVTELGDVPPVKIDGGRLGQVIVNLLVNATQAIPKDGSYAKVTVTTRCVGDCVEILVSDTGTGIPKEILPRIWAPFFTTKSVDVGTGLGLSISREIIERAGGEIRVETRLQSSEEGPRGSTFTISLPAAYATKPSRPSDAPMPSSPPSSDNGPSPLRRTVLIIEDEVSLAQALVAEIGRYHDVSLTHRAELALELFGRQRYDVVLCDLRMPGMSGEALYETVCARHPKQAPAFIFMSGIGFVPEVERFLAASGRPVLHKPFAPSAALHLIAQTEVATRA
jgi:PAS domain S-box-containing protein